MIQQMLFGRHIDIDNEGLATGREILTRCCDGWACDSISVSSPSGWRWVKWENGEREREGEEKKAGRSMW